MKTPAAPFKVGMDTALRASAALTAAGAPRIYTEVPSAKPGAVSLPYVVIGQDQVLPEDTGCGVEAEVNSTVQWWSKLSAPDGGAQARAIGAAILAALAADGFPVAGWRMTAVAVESERYVTDPDQSIHGIADLRFDLTEA